MTESKIEFIPDKEITLFQKTETEKGNDLLNTSTYVDALERCISSAPSEKTFTIGLFGEWGSGKSSIIKTAQERIEAKAKNDKKNVKFVTYDAWKYAGDSFRRMFLLELQKQLGLKPLDEFRRFFDNINEDVEVKHTTNNVYWYCILAFVALLAFLSICIDVIPEKLGFGLGTITALFTIWLNLKKYSTDDLKLTVQKSKLFAPEQFEECYKEIIEESRREPSVFQKALKWINPIHEKADKIIIVIDNIDRCQPDITYSLLSDIKSFLGDSQDVIFIVPVDVEALRKHIVNTNNRSTHDADEFLRKFFNVSIWIKPFQNDEMYDFTQNLNQKYNLQLSNTSVSVISREFATNPRRIIQLLNNLEIEFAYYEADFLKKYQALICLLTIIREEYPKDMKQLVYNPVLLFDYEDKETVEDKECKLSKDVCNLLRKTRSIFENLYEQRDVLDKILSNSSVFNELPQGTEDALYSVDMPSLHVFISNGDGVDQNKLALLKTCLCDRIKKAVERETYLPDLSNYVRTAIELHKSSLLVEEDYVSLNNVIHKKDAWDNIVADLMPKHYSNLSDFCVTLFDNKLVDLKNAISGYIKGLDLSEGKATDSQIKSVLNVCSVFTNKMITQPLIDQFNKVYHLRPRLALEQTYKEANKIFTDKLAKDVIYEIKADDFGFEETANWQFKQICIHKNLQNGALINEYLQKVADVMPSYNHDGSQNATLIQILTDVNDTLEACPNVKLTSDEGIQVFINNYQNVVSVNDRYRGSYTKSIYSDFKDSKENLREYTKLVKQLGSKYKQDLFFTPELISFMLTNEHIQFETINVLCDLANTGSPVEKYATSISAYPSVDDKYLSLMSYCFNNPDTNQPRVSDLNWVKARISEIVQLIIEEKDENLARFLDKESASETINNILTLHLSTLQLSELETLPIIRDKAVKTFEEYIDDYKDNPTVLSIIGRCGSRTGIRALVRIIVNKLTDHHEQEAINLIQTLHYCNPTDRRLIETTVAAIDEDIIDKETRKSISSKLESLKEG